MRTLSWPVFGVDFLAKTRGKVLSQGFCVLEWYLFRVCLRYRVCTDWLTGELEHTARGAKDSSGFTCHIMLQVDPISTSSI